MLTSDFDFDLPDDLIAQRPVEPRDQSRLMVVRRSDGSIEHRAFAEIADLLESGDVLVRNNTRVVPARLIGRREATGGAWEGLFLRELPEGRWEILAKTRGRPVAGERFALESGLSLILDERLDGGRWIVRPESGESASSLLERHGRMPLPPYIRKGRDDPDDRLRYQTVFARVPGAVAAPTAGLHFTDDVFRRLADRGNPVVDVTLHVGLGTFRPIEADRVEDHALHAEWAEITPETADFLNSARDRGARIVGVGTTSARSLETSARDGRFRPFQGETAVYLRPGHRFQGVDALVTNFHLPRSSLLVLVAAIAGYELMRKAYEAAIRERYRFYSYGDAMFIL